jgi:hypothetical protein
VTPFSPADSTHPSRMACMDSVAVAGSSPAPGSGQSGAEAPEVDACADDAADAGGVLDPELSDPPVLQPENDRAAAERTARPPTHVRCMVMSILLISGRTQQQPAIRSR